MEIFPFRICAVTMKKANIKTLTINNDSLQIEVVTAHIYALGTILNYPTINNKPSEKKHS
ncbi:hypothetical protein GGD38_002509 [Chitinophagaceae bacterium OAS944]|nr:hypothetical protein [Chitinophagaceae bacterium OAS944]